MIYSREQRLSSKCICQVKGCADFRSVNSLEHKYLPSIMFSKCSVISDRWSTHANNLTALSTACQSFLVQHTDGFEVVNGRILSITLDELHTDSDTPTSTRKIDPSGARLIESFFDFLARDAAGCMMFCCVRSRFHEHFPGTELWLNCTRSN
jgi:hypothetical protein